MNDSNFHTDLLNEKILASYLDDIYARHWHNTKYELERITDLDLQNKGVDLVLKGRSSRFYVDEKAQLDYLNRSLPTFAFEISYLKNASWRTGWLFDKNKLTQIYFLITGIHVNGDNLNKGIKSAQITGVYRKRLWHFLQSVGLGREKINAMEKSIRNNTGHGKIVIPQLDPRTEGYMYYSKENKAEQPINLVLKLDFLIDKKLARVIYP
ncbi:MAG: hypothetical protein CL868_17840 [Cytophagaceae bacterium]|nr:hypothetical protein [Cytophagaceae bacterium]|tara:strand:- start:6684 stop:7313 length:630 start_codon:yes stop_codon:yes gene_type:complete